MAVKKELRAIISADDRAFQRRMAAVKRTALDVGRGFVTIGAAGGAAFLALTRHTVNYADSLDKASLRLGINTDQLQRMRYAAQLAGVNQETFDTSLQRMTRRISEANKGNVGYIRALREIGLNFRDLENMNAGDQFDAVMQGLAGIGNQGARVRLAMQFFDTEGVRLVQMLGQGFDHMKRTMEAMPADLLLTEEQVRNGVRLNDNLSIMRAIIMGGLRSAVADTFPAMNESMENINAQLLEMIRSDAFRKIAAQSGEVAKAIAALVANEGIPLLLTGLKGLSELNAMAKPIEGMRELLGLILDTAAAMDLLAQKSLDEGDIFMAGPNADAARRQREKKTRANMLAMLGAMANDEASGRPTVRRALGGPFAFMARRVTVPVGRPVATAADADAISREGRRRWRGMRPSDAPGNLSVSASDATRIAIAGERRWQWLQQFLSNGPLGDGK